MARICGRLFLTPFDNNSTGYKCVAQSSATFSRALTHAGAFDRAKFVFSEREWKIAEEAKGNSIHRRANNYVMADATNAPFYILSALKNIKITIGQLLTSGWVADGGVLGDSSPAAKLDQINTHLCHAVPSAGRLLATYQIRAVNILIWCL